MSEVEINRKGINTTPAAGKIDEPQGDSQEDNAAYLQIRTKAINAFNKKYGPSESIVEEKNNPL